MKDILECYKVLDLHPGASADRVRRSYLELAAVWNPDKHLDNPALRSKMEKKRMEIDEAYVTLKQFLPELHHDYVPNQHVPEVSRDINEMVHQAPSETPKTIFAFLILAVLSIVFYSAYDIYKKTRTLPPAPVVLIDPEAVNQVASDTSTVAVSNEAP